MKRETEQFIIGMKAMQPKVRDVIEQLNHFTAAVSHIPIKQLFSTSMPNK
jgi:hypothetical protein